MTNHKFVLFQKEVILQILEYSVFISLVHCFQNANSIERKTSELQFNDDFTIRSLMPLFSFLNVKKTELPDK